MTTYALLLNHAPDRYDNVSEDEYMAIIKDYVGWVQQMSDDGIYQGGHKLNTGPGKVLTSGGGGVDVHDSPFAELSEVLGGLMLIEAEDYEHAVEIAKSCPHLVHNTTLEIREVDDVPE